MGQDIVTSQYASHDGKFRLICAVTENAKPNAEFEVHSHINKIEIYRFLDGSLLFSFEGKRLKVINGTVIVICNNTLHRSIITDTCRYVRQRILINKEKFTRFDTVNMDFYNKLRKNQLLVLNSQNAKEAEIDTLFDKIKSALCQGTNYDGFCALIHTLSLLIKIDEISTVTQEEPCFAHNEKVAEILHFINEHLREPLTYKSLSAKFYMSEKSLYKFFKREVGFTLSEYVVNRRIIQALAVLNAGGTAAQAAEASGFKDYTVFYRRFLHEVGMTPSRYIKNRNFSP